MRIRGYFSHLLVPGGKCATVRVSPVSFATFCNSAFQTRERALLLPPQSAMMSTSRAALCETPPMYLHQLRMAFTAKSGVSWSMPTETQASFLPMS